MNDRFKFRVWYKLYNGYVEKRDHLVLLSDGILCEYDGIEIDSDNYIIEQCTGIKDKNGNLIYEGDILLLHNNKFEVGNNNITVFFKCLTDKYTHIDPMDFDYNESEIIGNIHEQSEQKGY